MNFRGYPYYRLNYALLSFLGIGVYDNSLFEQIQRVVFSVLLATGVFVQLTVFFTGQFQIEILLKSMPFILFAFMFVLKYLTFWFSESKIRWLIDRIQNDWNQLQHEEEFEIMKKYANIGRIITLLFSLAIYGCITFTVLSQFLPFVLDAVIPLNASRTYELPIPVEYFVDPKKSPFFVLLHFDIVGFLGSTTIVATETMLVMFIQHICGLFKVASYRIRYALDESFLLKPAFGEKCVVCARMISAIDAHTRAMEFADYARTCFSASYFVLLLMGVLALSVNLYCFTQAVLLMNDLKELCVIAFVIIGQFGYVFVANYIGQDVIDHSDEILRQAYNTCWYIAPLPAQKLLLFVMQRSMKTCYLTVGGIYIPCYEGFSAISSTSLSYFMVIYSTQ